MKGFHYGKQEPEQGWSGHSPYLAALAAALAAAAGDTAPGEIKGVRILRREWRRERWLLYIPLPTCLLLHLFLLSVELFVHSPSILSLSLHLLSVLRSQSIHSPTNSLSICRLVDKTEKWMGEYMHRYMARWKDGGTNGWKLIHLSLSHSLCIHIPISLPTPHPVCPSIPLSIYQYLTCPPSHPPINLSTSLPVCLSHALTHASMQPFIHAPCIHTPVLLSTYVATYLHTHLFSHLLVHLPNYSYSLYSPILASIHTVPILTLVILTALDHFYGHPLDQLPIYPLSHLYTIY